MQKKQSELTVITKAKELCTYVMIVTQRSPKQFRYTFVSRMQNLSLDLIEHLYRANDVYITRDDRIGLKDRQEYQRKAMTDIRLLCYISSLAMEQKCILAKQYEEIAKQGTECMNYLGAWMNSDRKRLSSDKM